jgi:putative Holliday junction resolvase
MASINSQAKAATHDRVTLDPAVFAAWLPARGALIALDASLRRIGVAVTDPERRLVTPLATIARRSHAADLAEISRIVQERAAVGLVLGFPVSMDGREGPPAEAARQLAAELAVLLALPVLLQDERLTTFAVEQALRDGQIRLSRRRPRHLDHYAAAVILEDALRAMAGRSPQTPR